MSSTKVLLLVGLMLVTFITMVGGNPNHDTVSSSVSSNANKLLTKYSTASATGPTAMPGANTTPLVTLDDS